ncbi:hypothetical protein NBRC116188_14730 [Oceaniserpentilla sp. 4NH20-0058]|uniref:DUF6701 domain-containing protein n=1 Tax=Oceaniserpentilla sp. 4NH20-0058 TaxID=3127660 RepID=UPI00310A328B
MMNLSLIFGFIILLLTNPVWSDCSPYAGLVSINEVSKEHQFFNNDDDFIEIKKLDNTINNSLLDNWNIQICETIFIIFYSCSSVLSLSDADRTGKYWVYSGSPEPSSYIDWIGGFDIILTDENDDVVDYLTVNNVNPQFENCVYPFPISASGAASTRRTYRTPDGVGDWQVPTGNSVPPTEGEDNSTPPPLPAGAPSLSFLEDVVVSQGGSAVLTFVLNTSFTSDVVINYTTVNGDAAAGTDYILKSGSVTISAGQTQVTVNVDTIDTNNSVDSYFFMTIESATNADVVDQVAKITIIQASLADHFSITHTGIGVNCEAELITIDAMRSDNSIMSNYTGTIDLSTTTSNGDWSISGSTQGTLITGASDSGIAEYQFSSLDNGSVQLYLSNTHVETTNINIVDGFNISETTGNANQADDEDIIFQTSIFRFLYDDGVIESQIFPDLISYKPLQIDLVDHPVMLRAITTDIETGVCQSLFSGPQTIQIAVECNDPLACDGSGNSNFLIDGNSISENTGSVGSYTSVLLNFSLNSTARLPDVVYQDAGSITLHAFKALSGSNILGASQSMTFIPAGFCLNVNEINSECAGSNDADYASCSVFKKSGESFSVTTSAQGWESNGDLDFCDNNKTLLSFNHAVNLSPSLIAPSSGFTGYITQTSADLVAGTKTFDMAWSEMGVVSLDIGGNSYLSKDLPVTSSKPIGRFTPSSFRLTKQDDGEFNSANNGFTYTGQINEFGDGVITYDSAPQYQFDAVNAFPAADVLQNYIGDFFKNPQPTLNVTLNNVGNDNVTPLTLNSVLSAHAFSYQSSNSIYSASFNLFDHYYVERTMLALIAPFDLDVLININSFSDDDNITGNSLSFTPIGSEVRYGRLNIENAFGSELSELTHNMYAEYYDGQTFQLNELDSNTNVDISEFFNFLVTDVGDASTPLITGDTSLSGQDFDSGSLNAGIWRLSWSAPANGHYGTITTQYSSPSWLTYNWDESLDTSEEGPITNVTFGRYRGHDKIIYWKELY